MDKQAFKQRMQNLKSYRENNPGKGYWDWRNSLPDNLKYTDDTEYDMVGAYNSGAQPTLEDDGSYHLPTRVPSTGKILKSSIHPTYWKGLAEDEKLGYHTYWLPDGSTYTASKYDAPIQAFADGGEVDEFQRKTRRDIMQQSLVDGRPNYNKMFQNQNEYQKDFANYWYTERAKNPKYSDQIGGDKLGSVLSNVNKATWKTPTEAMRDNMVGQGYNPTDAQINQQLNILKEKGTKGFANPKAHSYTSLRPANTWHEGIGHMVGDNTPAILNAVPNVRISNPDSSYEDYVNQANEKHAQTWDFRGNNSNLKDDQGNYYIDPNRQLTPEDISNMRSKGAKIPEQWESLKDADISELTNTFAYNLSQDPIYYMASGGEVGDPDDKFAKAVNTKLGRTPDGRPLQQGLKPVFDLEDAANLTPVGDAIAAKDMYNAAVDKDWTGLGLAAASMIPFMPMTVKQFRKKYKGVTPKTSQPSRENQSKLLDAMVQDQINKAESYKNNRIKFYEAAIKDRDAEYDNWIENEDAFRRVVNFDRKYGTNYKRAYTEELKRRAQNSADLTDIGMKPMDSETFGSFNPAIPDYIFLNSEHVRSGKPRTGLVNHELGHKIDRQAGVFDYQGEVVRPIFDRNKFETPERIEKLYPKTHNRIKSYLLKDSEIKSHMNEFRTYLRNNNLLDPSGKESLNSFKKKLFDSNFDNLKKIFNSYKSGKQFIQDFNMVPITKVNNNNNNILV